MHKLFSVVPSGSTKPTQVTPPNQFESLEERVKQAIQEWICVVNKYHDCEASAFANNLPLNPLVAKELALIRASNSKTILQRLCEIRKNQITLAEASALITSDFIEGKREGSLLERDQELFKNAHTAHEVALPILQWALSQIDAARSPDPRGERPRVQGFEKLWFRHGYPTSVLQQHPEFVRFLKDSRLFFAIHGYLTARGLEAIQEQEDGHPCLLMQGKYVRWEDVQKRVRYDSEQEQVVSITDSSVIWNYFPDRGLQVENGYCQVTNPRIAYELSEKELDVLRSIAGQYNDSKVDENTHFVQVFTTTSNPAGLHYGPLTRNLRNQLPSHVGIRLIDNLGHVYSIGYEMPFQEQRAVTGNLPWTLLLSGNVYMSVRDYDEFRLQPDDTRLVTTIPVTGAQIKDVLEKIGQLTTNRPRFNYGRQNCSTYAAFVLRDILHLENIDFDSSWGEVIWNALPNADDLPYVGRILGPISRCARRILGAIPECVKTVAGFVWTVTAFIPTRLVILLRNLFFVVIWGSMRVGTEPLEPADPSILPNDDQQFPQSFGAMMGWSDLFNDRPGIAAYPAKVREWQRAQNSTQLLPYDGIRFYISSLPIEMAKNAVSV